ncbi:unnamed protein product [Schistocephalus solidus]|uniref:Uncharacterized protein n=1 Tax=Schistocephalus solidus TaxID=70667 RepID=A0A183SAT0_SCHSO|nr:unnamed protein product [Schistocephalus solidus]
MEEQLSLARTKGHYANLTSSYPFANEALALFSTISALSEEVKDELSVYLLLLFVVKSAAALSFGCVRASTGNFYLPLPASSLPFLLRKLP